MPLQCAFPVVQVKDNSYICRGKENSSEIHTHTRPFINKLTTMPLNLSLTDMPVTRCTYILTILLHLFTAIIILSSRSNIILYYK